MIKKFLILILTSGISTCVFSQTNVFPGTGNVGIGTNTPNYNLDVNGKIFIRGSGTYHNNPGSADLQIGYGLAPGNTPGTVTRLALQPYGHTGGPWKFNVRDEVGSASLDINYGILNELTIQSGGNIGIGTTAPVTSLHIENANINYASTLTLKNTANHIAARAGLTLENDKGNQTYFYKQASGNPDANDIILYSALGDTRIYTSGSERFRITNSGNIGIGTIDPKGYKLAVAGNMIAESVKVQLRSGWADYVFAKDYSLPTLEETEKHIKENGHLPGIPSAAEVKSNGIDLGEMNAKLLQKIEELTLYLIELNKVVKNQQIAITTQQMEIQNLKKK